MTPGVLVLALFGTAQAADCSNARNTPAAIECLVQGQIQLDGNQAALLDKVGELQDQLAVLQANVTRLEIDLAVHEASSAAELASLNARFSAHEASSNAMHAALWAEFGRVDGDLAWLDQRLDVVEGAALDPNLAALATYLEVDETSDDVRIVGANLHVQNGSGTTGSDNGLGNLVVGYNETYGDWAQDYHRTGSHNVVVGSGHGYMGHANIVSGFKNWVQDDRSVALGGTRNLIQAHGSALIAGQDNWIGREHSAAIGGVANELGAPGAVAVGGGHNRIDSSLGVIVAGGFNLLDGTGGAIIASRRATVDGAESLILGGWDNVNDNMNAVVIGGTDLTDSGDHTVTLP